MSSLPDYANKYQCASLERTDGILQVTLHTEGGPLRWGAKPHEELAQLFFDIGKDRGNKIVILTGTGDEFTGPRPVAGTRAFETRPPVQMWDNIFWEGRQLLQNMLNIEVPTIAAVNGPAIRHAELPLLCDIVLASENASFQDSGHFVGGLVPGDGVHVVLPMLLGINRARYFMLTGQVLDAWRSKELGLVAEVLPAADLVPRAWALARELVTHPTLHLRYTRLLMVEQLKRAMQDLLGYGLAVEGLALMERPLPDQAEGATTKP